MNDDKIRLVADAAPHRNDLGQSIGSPMPNWAACLRPPGTPMTGRFCRVEPLNPALHAESLYRAYADDTDGRNWTYLPYGPFGSCDEFVTWLNTDCVQDDPLFHTVIDLATDSPVGVTSYLRIQPSIGSIEVGHIHYSPRLQRTPAATEAMFLMMSRIFDELGYRRYEWKCDALNEPSRNAASRLGFSFEGIFRQATIYKGRSRDTAWFSIINQEWPLLQQAYQEWLSPENHDAEGAQRQSLSAFVHNIS
jgi:RimJ/RimL family protein N-acetyltransferase